MILLKIFALLYIFGCIWRNTPLFVYVCSLKPPTKEEIERER